MRICELVKGKSFCYGTVLCRGTLYSLIRCESYITMVI